MKQNPFTYTFGMKPKEYINHPQTDIIMRNFSFDEPTERAYMITGVRGSGKTVMLADIAEQMEARKDWIVIDLNPSRDLLQSLGAQLYELPFMKKHFADMKIDLSLFGFGVSIEKGTAIFDLETAIEKMLTTLKKDKKKLLITIDESAPGKDMQAFCLCFQKMLRKKLPVYMVLTGLYHNIHNLKNMDGCTFLQRTPFIVLEPLDVSAMSVRYKSVFNIQKEEAIRMAKLTAGYAFAFQVLGKLYFDKEKQMTLDQLMPQYESELIVYSYNKIWSELSEKDKLVLREIAKNSPEGVAERKALMKQTGFSSSMMNRYQARLRERGVLCTTKGGQGRYSFALPRFAYFIREYHMD